MMDVSAASSFEWDDADQRAHFLMVNGMAHETYYNTLLIAGNAVSNYPVMDVDLSERGLNDWFSTHYLMHKQASDILSIDDLPALADVDVHNADSFSDWLQQHQYHHTQIDQALNL